VHTEVSLPDMGNMTAWTQRCWAHANRNVGTWCGLSLIGVQ